MQYAIDFISSSIPGGYQVVLALCCIFMYQVTIGAAIKEDLEAFYPIKSNAR